jgi:predicted hydrocarbon binding protein
MTMQDRAMDEVFWHQFWKDFPAATDYFSPAIRALQSYLGFGSKDILYSLGEMMGRKVVEKLGGMSLTEVLYDLSKLWETMDIGHLKIVSRDPLTLEVSNCMICGQLAGTGGMYECAFHEGFFHGVLASSMRKEVQVHQDTNFEGQAGTWCRRFVSDIKMDLATAKMHSR